MTVMFDPGPIRAVVFDIGGTLLDFCGRESRAHVRQGAVRAHAYLNSLGINSIELGDYQKRIERRLLFAYLASRVMRREMDTTAQIRGVHTAMGFALDDPTLREVARRLYEPVRAIGSADARTAPTLATLRDRGYRLAVISNTIAPPPGLDDHLADQHLLDLLPVRVYSCEVGVPKPHPRIFRAALQRLELTAHQAVYVGDKPRIDVAGARRVGMQTILRHASDDAARIRPQPDRYIREIADLVDILPARNP